MREPLVILEEAEGEPVQNPYKAMQKQRRSEERRSQKAQADKQE